MRLVRLSCSKILPMRRSRNYLWIYISLRILPVLARGRPLSGFMGEAGFQVRKNMHGVISSCWRHRAIMWYPYNINLRHKRPIQASYTRRSEEHTSELQSRENIVCRLLLEKKDVYMLFA